MPIDDQSAPAAGSAALAAAHAGPGYGKKLEVPVRQILLGTPLEQAADPDSLANPEVLKFFTPRDAA